MNATSKRYFEMAYEYQIAALTLYTQIPSASYIYNPTAYLFRHAIELILKGLIIAEEKKSRRVRVDEIMVGNKKLDEIHSLCELWYKYTSLNKQIDLSSKIFIDKTIGKFNNRDPFSERFRYPRSKKPRKRIVEITLLSQY